MAALRPAAFLMLLAAPAAAAEPVLQGYVEGEYVRVGSPAAGVLAEVAVSEGNRVARGAPLFVLDLVTDRALRDQAAAQLAQAEARLADLRKGKRPDELAAIQARKAEAEASLALSLATLKRQEQLVRRDFAAQAQVELDRDRATVAQASADYRTALLGGREDEILAQQARIAEARAELAKADKRLADAAPPAPADAFVEKVYYRPGEYVPAGQPVVSLLPPANVKLVFFVPEKRLATVAAGQEVAFACDGCAAGSRARISFIAAQAEYTPPVIYSVGSRDKLVFRVEARPLAEAERLHPGQPVDVRAGGR
jgi:HlyD family secretion protein